SGRGTGYLNNSGAGPKLPGWTFNSSFLPTWIFHMLRRIVLTTFMVLAVVGLSSLRPSAGTAAAPDSADPPAQTAPAAAEEKGGEHEQSADGNIVYLTKQHDAWIDKKHKQVVMQGKIAVREGNLEMFACPQGTKEHESIVATAAKAFPAH